MALSGRHKPRSAVAREGKWEAECRSPATPREPQTLMSRGGCQLACVLLCTGPEKKLPRLFRGKGEGRGTYLPRLSSLPVANVLLRMSILILGGKARSGGRSQSSPTHDGSAWLVAGWSPKTVHGPGQVNITDLRPCLIQTINPSPAGAEYAQHPTGVPTSVHRRGPYPLSPLPGWKVKTKCAEVTRTHRGIQSPTSSFKRKVPFPRVKKMKSTKIRNFYNGEMKWEKGKASAGSWTRHRGRECDLLCGKQRRFI